MTHSDVLFRDFVLTIQLILIQGARIIYDAWLNLFIYRVQIRFSLSGFGHISLCFTLYLELYYSIGCWLVLVLPI